MMDSDLAVGTEAGLTAMRTELVGFAYRMLGSPFEAEDAVQETLLRAWRHGGEFDPDRASLRTWVYRIATNVCLDMLRSARRRALATDFAAPSSAAPSSAVPSPGDLGAPLPESAWVLPLPDRLLGDPAEVAERRESVRLAFVAALQHLPPRQRAVLILRDVLCWRAEEVAALLGTTVASVTSALQRARSTMRKAPLGTPSALSDSAQRDLVARYADAFHRDDIAGMVALLQRDATTSMPPFAWWVRGRDGIGAVMAGSDGSCHGARLVPDSFNGSPACWQFRPTGPGAAFEPFALVVFEVGDRLIRSMTTFLGDPVCLLAPPFPAAAPAPGAAVSGPGFAGRERG